MADLTERIYRDPVHNIIRLRTNTDEGRLMMCLIDAPEFQRLRRIKQLGLGLYTYQGAEHSRFTHSLGAFHLMTRVLDRLTERYTIANGSSMHWRLTKRAIASTWPRAGFMRSKNTCKRATTCSARCTFIARCARPRPCCVPFFVALCKFWKRVTPFGMRLTPRLKRC